MGGEVHLEAGSGRSSAGFICSSSLAPPSPSRNNSTVGPRPPSREDLAQVLLFLSPDLRRKEEKVTKSRRLLPLHRSLSSPMTEMVKIF